MLSIRGTRKEAYLNSRTNRTTGFIEYGTYTTAIFQSNGKKLGILSFPNQGNEGKYLYFRNRVDYISISSVNTHFLVKHHG